MGDDSLVLLEDGYIPMNFPITSLTYHSNLNVILVKTDKGDVHVLDVNSGVILQSSNLSADDGGAVGVEYMPGADRLFVWDSSGICARTDYNGVLLLHTALQRPLSTSQPENVINIELVLSEAVLLYQCLQSIDSHLICSSTEFINALKAAIDAEPIKKGVKAQKWSTVTLSLPQSTIRMVTSGVVQALKDQSRLIPALAIASAIGNRANELVPCIRNEDFRAMMYAESKRKETFKRWPHMDYKWALPGRMAQAGFYHQPSPSGDDRAMCFTCLVCLVCWERTDEPWLEHERHSPICPFVRGEYTHNVPISVTNATSCAVPCPGVAVVARGAAGDLTATGTADGKVSVWRMDCGLKLHKIVHLSPYDSIFSGILATDSNKVWANSLEKDNSTYGLELKAMAFVGAEALASLVCAASVTRRDLVCNPVADTTRALFDSVERSDSAKAVAPPAERMLFLLTYELGGASRRAEPSPRLVPPDKPHHATRDHADLNIDYGGTCLHFSDDELPADDADDQPKFAQPAVLDFVDKISQLKSWKVKLEPPGTKVADQPDSVAPSAEPYIFAGDWYSTADEPVQDAAPLDSAPLAVHCVRVPGAISAKLLPAPDAFALVLITEDEDNGSRLLVYRVDDSGAAPTIEDSPCGERILMLGEHVVAACALPPDAKGRARLATIGEDGILCLYALPDLTSLGERYQDGAPFVAVAYCSAAERLAVASAAGTVYFYALEPDEEDAADVDEDDSDVDVELLDEERRSTLLALREDLNVEALEQLQKLTGAGPTVPFGATVPGFWCEQAPARGGAGHARAWRLQGAAAAWAAHALELSVPSGVVQVELGYSLQAGAAAPTVPVLRAALLRRGRRALGHARSPLSDETQPNGAGARLVAGPLALIPGPDGAEHSGALVLTGPRLLRTRARTLLLRLEADAAPPAPLGCDWLNQISITVRAAPRSTLPLERLQRIAMLESDSFLARLCIAATDDEDGRRRELALDLLLWVLSVRLHRVTRRSGEIATETVGEEEALLVDQRRCVEVMRGHVDKLVRRCLLSSDRTVAKKCVKIVQTVYEGQMQSLAPWQDYCSIIEPFVNYADIIAVCDSPGSLRWFLSLFHFINSSDPNLTVSALELLEKISKCISDRDDVYHRLLRARFGLYGLPLERHIFAPEVPEFGRGTSTPVTYASVLSAYISTATTTPPKPEYQLKDLLYLPNESESATVPPSLALWTQDTSLEVFSAGLRCSPALHVVCHTASDGTKLESSGHTIHTIAASALPAPAPIEQLWNTKGLKSKQSSQDAESPEDTEGGTLVCDTQSNISDNIFLHEKTEQCEIPWAQVVSRPGQYTLVVERMHSGARRYIVLELQRTVRLTDVIIPSCSDLVTLGIDIWVNSEETDCEKLAYATDIASKHLVLTDIQPAPLCRFIKITFIGRYGMSAMKCKIPLGWFFGEIADIHNTKASVGALSALNQDLTCRFKLARGKLIELLNPYLDIYNAETAHMMAYLNLENETDTKVVSAYQECMELQQQLNTCDNILNKLNNINNKSRGLMELAMQNKISSDELLDRCSTDKLRVISDYLVELLLYLIYKKKVVVPQWWSELRGGAWWERVWAAIGVGGARAAAAWASLASAACGSASWWGRSVARHLSNPQPHHPPDRCLVLTMVLVRRTVLSGGIEGVAEALCWRALEAATTETGSDGALPPLLAALALALDDAAPNHSRWEWVSGGRVSPRDTECKRKLPFRKYSSVFKERSLDLLVESNCTCKRCRPRRSDSSSASSSGGPVLSGPVVVVSPVAGTRLAKALLLKILEADASQPADSMMLQAKVVGRLAALGVCGPLLQPHGALRLSRLAVTLPPWPAHAVSTLILDLVEYSSLDNNESSLAETLPLPPDVFDETPRKIEPITVPTSLPKQCEAPIEAELSSEPNFSDISSCVEARLEGLDRQAEVRARAALVAAGSALASALRARPSAPVTPTTPPEPIATAPPTNSSTAPLAPLFYNVFEQLADDFLYQSDSTVLEKGVELWMWLNGGTMHRSSPSLPSDAPKICLSANAINKILRCLVEYEHVSLRCWVLTMQALAWIANWRIPTECPTQWMWHFILESEHFIPALSRLLCSDLDSDGATKLTTSHSHLYGSCAGAGAGSAAASALSALLSRIVSGRGPAGAVAALCLVRSVWSRSSPPATNSDLRAALLRHAALTAQPLAAHHAHHALELIRTVAGQCGGWVRGYGGASTSGGGAVAGVAALLGEALGGSSTKRRAPDPRALLAMLLHYCRRLLLAPHPQSANNQNSSVEGTNVEDEKKQQAVRIPCLADAVLEQPTIMMKLYRALQLCDGIQAFNTIKEPSSENSGSLKEEMFWLVAQTASAAAHPIIMLDSLVEFLKRDEVIHLSQAMQMLILRLLDKAEIMSAFIAMDGLDLAIRKMIACHKAGPDSSPGTVSSLMNYLKTPSQLLNMSTPVASSSSSYVHSNISSKKPTQPAVETFIGLVNIAPLCKISCGNPTAQSAEVLVGGSSGSGAGGSGGAAACAARRVRAPAWSYHFFNADDTALPLTLTLPYVCAVHEVHLQPHLTSLSTCPGAVGVEAGVGGALASLGPPLVTAGVTHIRLVLARPVLASTIVLRLHKPRDASNMGLLQLKLFVAPAFSLPTPQPNLWAGVVWAAGGAGAARLAAWCSGPGARPALAALLAAPAPSLTPPALALHPDTLYSLLHYHTKLTGAAWWEGAAEGCSGACGAVRSAVLSGNGAGALQAALRWAPQAARAHHAAPLLHTVAQVLWKAKEENLIENLEEMITEDLFMSIFLAVRELDESKKFLKRTLDALLCSMCYVNPELFRLMLQVLNIPSSNEKSMCVTDDAKAGVGSSASTSGAEASDGLRWARRGALSSLSACAMSPPAASLLLHASALPIIITNAITEFGLAKLQQFKQQCNTEDVEMTEPGKKTSSSSTEIYSLRQVVDLLEWLHEVSGMRVMQDWLGNEGSGFWRPLLALVCAVSPEHENWQEQCEFDELEENTIQLFSELIAGHSGNQKLFATTLHSVLQEIKDEGAETMTGFTRSLIVRLVLCEWSCRVAVRWGHASPHHHVPHHPSYHHHSMLTLPASTTISSLLELRPTLPIVDDGTKFPSCSLSTPGTSSVLRSASDTAITTVAAAWELSLAAASASKDKRVKDVKNTTLKQQSSRKRQNKSSDASVLSVADVIQPSILVVADGIEGFIPGHARLSQLSSASPNQYSPHLSLTLHLYTSPEAVNEKMWEVPEEMASECGDTSECGGGVGVMRWFGNAGGLALAATLLPRAARAPAAPHSHLVANHVDLDWVKIDDVYEELVEGGSGSGSGSERGRCSCYNGGAALPAHTLAALRSLLALPGYAGALLQHPRHAYSLLRLMLAVPVQPTHHHNHHGRRNTGKSGSGGCGSCDCGEGCGGGGSLGTLPFRVAAKLLEEARGEEATTLRTRLAAEPLPLLLACLAAFTHHHDHLNNSSMGGNSGKGEDKSQLYWAKGTGFGTGSMQQSTNVEQALLRQRTEEEHVTVLLQVLSSYMNPGEKWPPESSPDNETEKKVPDEFPKEEKSEDDIQCESETANSATLPQEFIDQIANSALIPAVCSYLRNDSVLDMSRHITLYVCVLRVARALLARRKQLAPALPPNAASSLRRVPALLAQMSRTTHHYAAKLRMSKKNLLGKNYSQRFSTSSNSELSEEDEGLAALIADIQATAALTAGGVRSAEPGASKTAAGWTGAGAGRDARYVALMRPLQFETGELLATDGGEGAAGGLRFAAPFSLEALVRAGGSAAAAHPARAKRLAQEAAALATSLPLSYCSSVFVRADASRLDLMKVLITGPADTPYADGCFLLDVYFPPDYPSVPMAINLETTGRHSVRFNPNLYNDGKVCLSVLNTWYGRPEEKWNAHTSSFLQVLVSIQSLILVPEPYFNEPGYERSRGTRAGAAASLEYNSNIYQACVRWAMLDHLRHPPACFKEVIETHFWIKRNEILATVARWIAELEAHPSDERSQRTLHLNLAALKRHYVKLQEELAKLTCPPGLEDLDEPLRIPEPTPLPVPVAPAPAEQEDIDNDIDHDLEKMVLQVLD